jgi:hypothetical protein
MGIDKDNVRFYPLLSCRLLKIIIRKSEEPEEMVKKVLHLCFGTNRNFEL